MLQEYDAGLTAFPYLPALNRVIIGSASAEIASIHNGGDSHSAASIKPQAEVEMAYKIKVNGTEHQVDVDSDTPLLWVLRDNLGLTGTKFGCGISMCGACTVHLDGSPTRSCVTPISSVGDAAVVTIEGISPDHSHKVQRAWIAEDVPQCGYCQSGMIMAVAALLARTPKAADSQISSAISNICRCGTYQRIRRAIHRAAAA
jgi:isoquinoline 1-oxidoreductase subunit alpha